MKKISIKREQSQAGLSFAEREKFRPQVKNKLLLLLALLLTAATGAWATTPNSIVINGTPQVGDKSISLTYHFDPNNVPNLDAYAPTLKVKCAADNKWDETLLSLTEVSSGTTTISLSNLGEFEAGKTYEVCFAYNNGNWVDDVFQSFVPAAAGVPKHLITATYDEQTRLLEQPLPYATTIGALYEAVTGKSFSDLLTTMTAMNMTLSGIGSTNTSVVSIGELNGASTPVTVNADGKAAVALRFGSYAQGIFVSVTPPLYVTMADGVKDADKWTVKVGDGEAQALPIGGLKGDGSETVTLQYNGRLKVKGVKATSDAAPAVKPAATVTTAPTGAAIVGVGKTTALVSGGVADGGTLWYAVTTTNTKPASTDGFSDTVPTAETITASGKVYVWYYVKGDDTHSDSEIAATAIEVTVMAVPITVTWNPSDIVPKSLSDKSFTKDGITFTAAECDFQVLTFGGGGTFTTTLGNFTKIEISADFTGNVSGTGWTNDGWQSATWTGNAASVSFSGDIWGGGMTCEGGNLKIVFTIE